MRSYPRNSPEAAGRIVALALIADGHYGAHELQALERLDLAALGLNRERLAQVLNGLCEDLLAATPLAWSDMCRIEPDMLAALMAEVDDPRLRERLLSLCLEIVEADGHVSEGESILLTTAVEQWGLHRRMVQPSSAALGASV